jgi:hypothetical protein
LVTICKEIVERPQYAIHFNVWIAPLRRESHREPKFESMEIPDGAGHGGIPKTEWRFWARRWQVEAADKRCSWPKDNGEFLQQASEVIGIP